MLSPVPRGWGRGGQQCGLYSYAGSLSRPLSVPATRRPCAVDTRQTGRDAALGRSDPTDYLSAIYTASRLVTLERSA